MVASGSWHAQGRRPSGYRRSLQGRRRNATSPAGLHLSSAQRDRVGGLRRKAQKKFLPLHADAAPQNRASFLQGRNEAHNSRRVHRVTPVRQRGSQYNQRWRETPLRQVREERRQTPL